MERTMWTDERLDERFNGIDRRFDHVDGDLREVRTDLRELRSLLIQLWGSTILGLIGVIVTVLITNA